MKQSSMLFSFISFLKNFPLGLLVGFASSMAIAWAIDESTSDAGAKNWTYLASIAATLVVGSLATAGVLTTVENNRRLAEESRWRKLAASKSSLPLALSELMDVCDQRTKFTLTYEFSSPPSSLSETSIGIFKDCIELSDSSIQGSLAEIILAYQIAIARDRSAHSETALDRRVRVDSDELTAGDRYTRFLAVIDWQALSCLAETLFSLRKRNLGGGRSGICRRKIG